MVEHDRRTVLAYAGLTTTGGLLTTGAAVADDTAGESGGELDGETAVAESDGWSSRGGNPGNNPVVPAGAEPDQPVTVAWEYEHGGPTAIVDGTVYLTADGEVHALDADDGSVEWQTHNIGATGTPAVANGTVCVGGERLTMIDAGDGEICCQHDLGYDESIASPVVAGGHVLTVGEDTLYAFDADEREVAWEFAPEGDPLYEQPVAVADGAVFAVSESRLFARELADGTGRWTDGDPEGDDDYSRFMEPNPRQTSSPVATDEVVAIGSADTDEYAMWPLGYTTLYDVETGEKRVSSERSPFDPGPITDDRFYGLESHNATGYDRETGGELWDTEVNTYRVPSMAVGDGIVYAGLTVDGEGYEQGEIPDPADGVYAFDAETGAIEWAVGTDGIPEIAVDDGTIYASSETLVAIRSEAARVEQADESDEDSADDNGSEEENGDGDSEGSADGEGNADDEGSADDEEGGNGTDDGNESGNETDDDGFGDENTESGNESNESDDEGEGMPGFTAGAGVVGGAAALEWLRRRTDDGDDADDPAETA